MPPTLASLVRTSALGLTVLAGVDRLDAAVRWVHTSELDDPTPYLEGGELVLTTGLNLSTGAQELGSYVHRLADAGVVGLGFGVGISHDTVPAPLVTAAEEHGLPLLRVPRPTPFIAISKTVSAAIAADQYKAVTTSLEAQRELTRAALAKDGTGALLVRLAAHLDGWAALYDASGDVVDAAPEWAGRRAARLAGEIERLRERPAPVSAAVAGPGGAEDRVEIQSLGTGRRARGFLAVGTGERLAPSDRYVVQAAVALLTLSLEQSRTLQEAERRFAAAVLRMVLVGETAHARTSAGRLYGTLLDRPSRILVAEPSRGAKPAAGAVSEAREQGAWAPSRSGGRPAEAAVKGRALGTTGRPRTLRAGGEGGTDQAKAVGEDAGTLPEAVAVLAEQVEAASARAAEPVLVAQEGARLTVLASDGGAVLRACLVHLAADEALASGLSAAVEAEEVPEAAREAERALAVAQRRGRSLVEHDELGAGSILPLLGDDAVRAFADGLLRPLREHDATSRGDLVASLQAWLSRHGQWDAAAADLGVHRHTLRYRMRRVEEILGRSLDDPDVRMELWLALKAGV